MLSNAGDWRSLRLRVFDAPTAAGDFAERHAVMMSFLPRENAQIVPMHFLHSMNALPELLERVVSRGGEGLMIHKRGRSYRGGRVDGLLKFKSAHSAAYPVSYEMIYST